MINQPRLPGAQPTHRIYNVTGTGKSAFWTPIGAAWPNQDGQGFSIRCEAMPLQGRIVMRAITKREKREAALSLPPNALRRVGLRRGIMPAEGKMTANEAEATTSAIRCIKNCNTLT